MRVSFYFERSCPERRPRAALKPQDPRSSGRAAGLWTPSAPAPAEVLASRESWWSRGRGASRGKWQAAGAISGVGKAVLTFHPPLGPLA
jgi:hypothetical protein